MLNALGKHKFFAPGLLGLSILFFSGTLITFFSSRSLRYDHDAAHFFHSGIVQSKARYRVLLKTPASENYLPDSSKMGEFIQKMSALRDDFIFKNKVTVSFAMDSSQVASRSFEKFLTANNYNLGVQANSQEIQSIFLPLASSPNQKNEPHTRPAGAYKSGEMLHFAFRQISLDLQKSAEEGNVLRDLAPRPIPRFAFMAGWSELEEISFYLALLFGMTIIAGFASFGVNQFWREVLRKFLDKIRSWNFRKKIEISTEAEEGKFNILFLEAQEAACHRVLELQKMFANDATIAADLHFFRQTRRHPDSQKEAQSIIEDFNANLLFWRQHNFVHFFFPKKAEDKYHVLISHGSVHLFAGFKHLNRGRIRPDEQLQNIARLVRLQSMAGKCDEDFYNEFSAEAGPDLLFLAAMAHLKDGDVNYSISKLEAAISERKDFPQALFNLAKFNCEFAQDQKNAATFYKKYLQLLPKADEAWNNLAVVSLLQKNHRSESKAAFEKAIRLNPQNQLAQDNIGTFYRESEGDLKKADEHYKLALDINPDFKVSHFNMGILHRMMGKIDEARAELEMVIELDADFSLAHFALANHLRQHYNDYSAAVEHYQETIRANKYFDLAYTNLANLLAVEFQNFEGAKKQYLTSIRISPKKFKARYNLALLLKKYIKDDDGARRYYLEACGINPNLRNDDNDKFFGVEAND